MKPTGPKFRSEVTWEKWRQIFDENDVMLKDFYFCIGCSAIYNINISNSGRCLKKHATECVGPNEVENRINDHFSLVYHASKRRKITRKDRTAVKEASIKYIVSDLRPIVSINGTGLTSLLASMTQIGAIYDAMSEKDLETSRLIPTRQTVCISVCQKNSFANSFSNLSLLQLTTNISSKAEDVRAQMKQIIKKEFRKYGGSIALDCWMDKQTKSTYFGLTAHYISNGPNDRLELNDRVLVIRELAPERAKNGEFLREKVMEYLTEFEIDNCIEKNMVFMSDRGTNICVALRGFKSSNCFAHMLNNALYQIFKKQKNKSFSEHNWAYQICHHATAIVKYFKASSLSKQFKPALQSNVCTRWNSNLNMLTPVIHHFEKITNVLTSSKSRMENLNAITLDELKILADFLKPFKTATDEVEASHHPTMHKVIPNFLEMCNHLEEKPSDPACIVEIKAIVRDYWQKNVQKCISIYHQLALFLHPNTKTMKTLSVDQKSAVWDRAISMMNQFMPPSTTTTQQKDSRPSTTSKPSDSAMRFCFDDSESETEEQSAAEAEIEDYKKIRLRGEAVNDLLSWWHENKARFPRLYGVARFIHSIPGSSAAAERLFSIAGRLVAFRPNMRTSLVDEMLFLRSNIDLERTLVLQGEDIDDDDIETISINSDEGYSDNNDEVDYEYILQVVDEGNEAENTEN